MPKAKTPGTKKHNWVTGPNNKIVQADEDRATMLGICSCNHLTPASEAALDNLLGWKVLVPTKKETIERNEPGFEPEVEAEAEAEVEAEAEAEAGECPDSWETGPTAADMAEEEALAEIEAEVG